MFILRAELLFAMRFRVKVLVVERDRGGLIPLQGVSAKPCLTMLFVFHHGPHLPVVCFTVEANKGMLILTSLD